MPRGKKPSRDEILEGIRKAWKRGDDLRYSGVTRGKNRWLERSGRHYFSDWNEMLEEVGLSQEIVKQKVEGPRRKKRKQKLLADLAKAYADGIDLSGSAIQAKGNPNRGLRDRAKYAFSGRFFWHNALRAAKLPVEEIIRQRLWDKEKVKRELIARNKAHKPINVSAVKDDDPSLYKACLHHFNNCYDDALRYAGFDPDEVRLTGKPMNKKEILLKVIELHIHGQDLNSTAIQEGSHSDVYNAATKKFDNGWREPVELIGVDYFGLCQRKKGYWTPERVIDWIVRLHESGEPVNSGYISTKHSDLYHAGYRLFPGRWNEALLKSGLNPREVYLASKLVSIAKVLKKIRALDRRGWDLSPAGMTQYGDEQSHVIYMRAMREFGDWGKVLQEAGLPADQISKFLSHSLQRLIQAAKDLEARGISLTAQDAKKSPLSQWLFFAAIRHFDSWKQFLERAGIASVATEAAGLRSGSDVIKYLMSCFESGLVTESGSENLDLLEAAGRHFGGIPQAVKAASMIYSIQGEVTSAMLDDEKVIGALYRFNGKFTEQLAGRIIDGERTAGRQAPNRPELTFWTFATMLEVLPAKPPAEGLRSFCSKRVLEKFRTASAASGVASVH